MPDQKISLEVILPDETRAVSETINLENITPSLYFLFDTFILERLKEFGWWKSSRKSEDYEISGVKLILRRKKPLELT